MTAPLRLDLEGKYEILEKIKEGGMGTVYKVRHRFLDEIRVIKVIRSALAPSPELSDRFLREAKTAIRLRHPSLAVLYDFAIADDGNAFIVMEYIAGMTLEDLLRTGGPPPLGLALEIAAQALRAIGFLHRHRFVHRDIAPDNLMLTRGVDGEPLVKLIDLGIAKVLTGDGAATSTGIFLGKPRYASPEHFGVQELDQRSDLYSFGVVLYELLTGQCPVSGHDAASYMAGHLFRPPRDFAESDPSGALPPELRRILLRTLAKSRTERFASAAEIAGELAPLQDRFPVQPGDLEAVLEPSTRRTAPWTMPPPVGSSQVRLDRQFLAAGPTPQPAAGTGAPAGHATLPAASAAPSILPPAPDLAAVAAVPPPPPAPRSNPALDDTLPLTVQAPRPTPAGTSAVPASPAAVSAGHPATTFPAAAMGTEGPLEAAIPPAAAPRVAPPAGAAGALQAVPPAALAGSFSAAPPSPAVPRPLAARTLAGVAPPAPGDSNPELPLTAARPAAPVAPAVAASPRASSTPVSPATPILPATPTAPAADWEARPLLRTGGGVRPGVVGAAGAAPTLTLRRPLPPALPRPDGRPQAGRAGRPVWGWIIGAALLLAAGAGVWWYAQTRPVSAGAASTAGSAADSVPISTATGDGEPPRSIPAADGGGGAAPGGAPMPPTPSISPRRTPPPRQKTALLPPPATPSAMAAVQRRDRTLEETGKGTQAGGRAIASGTSPGSAGQGAGNGAPPRRHPTVPPLEPGVEAPEPADVPDAVYPEAARGSGLAPTVRLAVLVDEKGNVAEVRVLEGDTSHLGFNEAAVTAVRRARFVAATKDGTPVRAWSELAVDFVSPSAHP